MDEERRRRFVEYRVEEQKAYDLVGRDRPRAARLLAQRTVALRAASRILHEVLPRFALNSPERKKVSHAAFDAEQALSGH